MKIRTIIFLLLLAMAAGAQVTPAKILRIAGNNTVLGENVPVGTLIIDVAAQKQYIVTAALGAGAKLSESAASLREMAAAAALGTLSAQSSDNVTISGGTITNTTITPGTGNVTASGFTGSGSTSGAVDLGTAEVSGTLPVANGGTGAATATAAFDALSPITAAGDILYGGSGGTGTRLAAGSAGQVLTINTGGTAPEWVTPQGLEYWSETGGTGFSQFTVLSGDTDAAAIIAPKGTGAFRLGASGNARGSYAVDLQRSSNATKVASGAYSVLGGGRDNLASGTNSVVSGGYSNTASNYSAVVGGGELVTASGDYSGVLSGASNTASNSYSTVGGGRSNTASGEYSTVFGGLGNTAQSYGESVAGIYATTGSGDATSYIAADRLFVIGNGTANASRSNALVMLKNGNTTLNGNFTAVNITATGIAASNISAGSPATSHITVDGGDLTVAGDAEIDGDLWVDGTLSTPSDLRLKTGVETLTGVLASIERLRGVSYTYIDQDKYATGPQVGVIAQELQQVYPDLVIQGADGFLAVNYSQLTAVLLQGVKEQQKEIDVLKEQMQKVLMRLGIE